MQKWLGLQKDWKADVQAGFILFLVALPLSVGIALASGAPASAGIIAAIVGGVIGSFLGGGHININGPAAGLITIVLSSVQLLGRGDATLGFKLTLAAIVIAGILQVLVGVLGWAKIGLAFPSSVIHGMLTAIGVIIIAKQVHVALGVAPQAKSAMGLILEIPRSLVNLNGEVALIGLTSFIILIGHQKLLSFPKLRFLKYLPAPLLAVATGILMGVSFDLHHHHVVQFFDWNLEADPRFLLKIPENLTSSIIFPDFSQIMSFDSWRMIMTIFLVASLESTLSAYAVDKLDPERRHSNLNRDMWSKGICNLVCGLIGGLPIITEIVRSTANIANGAKSKLSNFMHGIFILAFVALFPWMLNEIPLASLAAILIVVGWRLAHPSQFKEAYHIGPDHILAFSVTLIVTLAFDLLLGIFAGLVVEFAIALVMGVKPKDLFKPKYATQLESDQVVIESQSPIIFSNSLKLRTHMLDFLGSSKNVTVDLSKSHFIDHSFMDQLDSIKDGFKERGLDFEVITSPDHQPLSKHELSSRRI